MYYSCKRRNKRTEHAQEVLLCLTEDLMLQAQSTNISMDGLEIRCNQETAERVMPCRYPINLKKAGLVKLEVCLEDVKKPLQVTCSVKNMYRLAQDLFCFNLKFTPLEEQSQRQLEGFINS